MKKYLILVIILAFVGLTGCAGKAPGDAEPVVALVNGERITPVMVEEKTQDLLYTKYLQEKSLKHLKGLDSNEVVLKKIDELEKNLAQEITANQAFNELVREIVQKQEAKKHGFSVSHEDIEKIIQDSRDAEKNLLQDSEDYRLIQETKKKFMELKGLKTEKDYEDYRRQSLGKILLIGRLRAQVDEESAMEIAKEYPGTTDDDFRELVKNRYHNYVEKLVANARIKIKDQKFTIETRLLLDKIPDADKNLSTKIPVADYKLILTFEAKEVTEKTREVIKQRAEIAGLTIYFDKGSGDTIRMEIPHCADPDVYQWLVTKGEIRFQDPDKNMFITRKDIQSAIVKRNMDQESLVIEFNKDGAKKFAQVTTANVGKSIAIKMDQLDVASPMVAEPITSGEVQVTGPVSPGVLEAVLNTELLDQEIKPVQVETIKNKN